MLTYSIKSKEIKKKWLMIDVDGLVLGRVASATSSAVTFGSNLYTSLQQSTTQSTPHKSIFKIGKPFSDIGDTKLGTKL